MCSNEIERQSEEHWDNLHKVSRFLPLYPDNNVVRFLMNNFRQKDRSLLRVLDIGVGGGRHLKLLCELGFQVFGTDISRVGIKHCEQLLKSLNYKASVNLASMCSLPYTDGYFDVAISYGVYYYTDFAGMCKAIAELYRVLEFGASAFIVLRTTNDYRYGKGKLLENNVFQIEIKDTNEYGSIQCFLSEVDVPNMFSLFSKVMFEKCEITFNQRKAVNSDWLITVKK